MIWFTADTHFDHKNILFYAKRPWKTTGEMNDALSANWNSVVSAGDVVYHLGDFAFRNHEEWISRLNGHVVLIEGSHDGMSAAAKKKLEWVGPRHTVKENKEFGTPEIVLSHYAMRAWPKSHYGTWHLFGHSHGLLPPFGFSFDVGVDPMGFFPVSLPEVARLMLERQYDSMQDIRSPKIIMESINDRENGR